MGGGRGQRYEVRFEDEEEKSRFIKMDGKATGRHPCMHMRLAAALLHSFSMRFMLRRSTLVWRRQARPTPVLVSLVSTCARAHHGVRAYALIYLRMCVLCA